MSVLLQIFVHRELSPQAGQVYLDEMIKQIDRNPQAAGHGSPQAVKITGITRFENPFPEPLQHILEHDYKLTYDSINLCYFGQFKQEANAERWMRWFDTSVRPWIAQTFPAFDATLLHVRLMTEHDAIAGTDSF